MFGSARRDGRESATAKYAEILIVAIRAFRAASTTPGAVFHFIDCTFLLLACWVLTLRKPTVYYASGPMDALLRDAKEGSFIRRFSARAKIFLLKKAAATQRFAIVCETIGVQQAINGVVGRVAVVIPYGVEPIDEIPDRNAVRARLNLPDDATVLLLFGTQREGKDYATVFAAAEMAQKKVILLFVGAVISDNDPQRIAAKRNFQEARFVREFVPAKEVPEYFAAADAVILPYEGNFIRGSGVLVESCRFHRPLIVADTGHLASFVWEYQCGFVYAQGNARSLADVIETVAALDETQAKCLQCGLQRAAADHSWEAVGDRYRAVYEGVSEKKWESGRLADPHSLA
jgi:glycosyltransferase involved in cell wall biosynthesis